MRPWRTFAIAFGALAAFATLTVVPGQTQEPFYKGKTISLIIGTNASGGYDTYGRLVARHMGKYLPGNPSFVVQNMPGAAGLRSANYIYNIAPRDGTVFGIFDQGILLDQMLGVAGLRGDVTRFNWIGRMISNSAVLYAWHTAAVKKIEDAYTHELIVAASGSSSRLNWTALNTLVGTKFRLVFGYEGPATSKIAMERGEVDALSSPWSVLVEEHPDWISEKKINPLLQTGLEKNKTLPDLPRMVDLAKNDDDRKVLEIFAAPSLVGRSFAAPPGLPQERVDELRSAYTAMLRDSELNAEIDKLKIDFQPLSGAELQAYVSKSYPTRLLDRAKEIAKFVH